MRITPEERKAILADNEKYRPCKECVHWHGFRKSRSTTETMCCSAECNFAHSGFERKEESYETDKCAQ